VSLSGGCLELFRRLGEVGVLPEDVRASMEGLGGFRNARPDYLNTVCAWISVSSV
jgi:hypothetical protein